MTLLSSPLVTGLSRLFSVVQIPSLTTWLSFPEGSLCGTSGCADEEGVLLGDEEQEGTLFWHTAFPVDLHMVESEGGTV